MRPRALLFVFGTQPWSTLLLIAAAGTLLGGLVQSFAILPSFCGGTAGLVRALGLDGALRLTFDINPPGSLLSSWVLMLIGMMSPLVAEPIQHVYWSSLPTRRLRAISFFCSAYIGIWTLAGIVLTVAAMLIRLAFSGNLFPVFFTVVLALFWSSTPFRQVGLNRCHRVRSVGLFGWKADRDAMEYGFSSGVWCVASCWAWMLVPLVTHVGHLAAMLVVSAILLVERLKATRKPAWRIPAIN